MWYRSRWAHHYAYVPLDPLVRDRGREFRRRQEVVGRNRATGRLVVRYHLYVKPRPFWVTGVDRT